jgi:tetratricopeptide (TPR) repeat protein
MLPDQELPDFDAKWNFGDPAGSEREFRSILERRANAPQAYRLALRTQIARALGLQRKFDEAQATLDAVERELDESPVPRIRCLLERGRVLNSSARPLEARPLFAQAMQLGQQHQEDRLAVDAAHMLAITLRGEEALRANLEALRMAEASTQEGGRNWKGSLYNNIGWSYHDLGDYQRALEYFEKGVEFRQQQGKPGPLHVARWAVARALRSLGRFQEALDRQRQLETTGDGGEDPYVAEEIGECLLALGKGDEARPHFSKAHQGLKDDVSLLQREPERLARLATLGAG